MSRLPINQVVTGDCREVMTEWPEEPTRTRNITPIQRSGQMSRERLKYGDREYKRRKRRERKLKERTEDTHNLEEFIK